MTQENKHSFTGEECCVWHMIPPTPQCKKCEYCGWVKYPYDSECKEQSIKSAEEGWVKKD